MSSWMHQILIRSDIVQWCTNPPRDHLESTWLMHPTSFDCTHTLACCCCLALSLLSYQGLFDSGVWTCLPCYCALMVWEIMNYYHLGSMLANIISSNYWNVTVKKNPIDYLGMSSRGIWNSQFGYPGICGNCQIARELPNCLIIAWLPENCLIACPTWFLRTFIPGIIFRIA